MDQEMTPARRIREEAKTATRLALLEAGLVELIESGGLELPSIDAICARAGYSRGPFHALFEGRGQYVTEMLEWVISDIAKGLFDGATKGAADVAEIITRFNQAISLGDWPDLHQGIRAGYLGVLRELRGDTRVRRKHTELMTSVIGHLEEKISEGQAAGKVRPDLDARHVALLLMLSAVGSVMWHDVGIDLDMQKIGRTLIQWLSIPQ